MPSRCCVPNCRGNYDTGPKVSVFKFPEEVDLRRKWINSIPRQNFQPTKATRVCELHFRPCDVQRITEMYDEKTGMNISAPLAYPRLIKNAVPLIFPGCPSYLSSSQSCRQSADEKKLHRENEALRKALVESMKEKEAYDSRMKFTSIVELYSKIESMALPDCWSVIKKPNVLLFSIIEMEPVPVIVVSVLISEDMQLSVFINNVKIASSNRNYIFPELVNDLNQLSCVLENVKSFWYQQKKGQPNLHVMSQILKIFESYDNDDSLSNVIKFIRDQIMLLDCKKECRRYTADMLVFSSLLYSISPHAYRFMLSSQNFILPHPSTLRRVISNFQLKPMAEQKEDGFLSYIKCKFSLLSENDHKIVLMMDEIHLKPYFDYKGGSIFGASHDSVNAATTAYVFMIQSLLSKYKDVVHILPVRKLTGPELFNFLKMIIIGLEEIGFMVITVVSDNNAINRKAISYFSTPPELRIVYKHPFDTSRPLFFCIDSVHIIKCVRNNWINQKKSGQCLFYPDFDTSASSEQNLLTANFSTLRKMHQLESGEGLLKYGYGLTLKALNPSNLERQNVNLALKIFNRFIVQALREMGGKHTLIDHSSTALFIEIICTWFEIVNVKSPNKGKRLNNVYQEPMTKAENDERQIFLEKFWSWLDQWKQRNSTAGTFSRDTHLALAHTTCALLEMCTYCIEELKFKYFLPGKVQTDMLEDRFGKYRQLSGSNYDISITQIFECESKLRMQDSLPLTLNSSKFGNILVNKFSEEIVSDDSSFNENDSPFRKITVTENDLNSLKVLPIITYLAGYCIYKFLRKIQCQSCLNNLTLDKKLDLDISYRYIRNLDRGGLLCPHPDVVHAVSFNYIIVSKLLSKDHEDQFLQVQGQRSLVVNLTFHSLIEQECLSFDQCTEGHSIERVLKYVLQTATNTLLKNYCSQKNDVSKPSSSKKKRKLETFKK